MKPACSSPSSSSRRWATALHQPHHSALTHAALAYSGHTSVASLARYARVSPDALARWQQQHDPATRR
jgi:hypothetical protein